MFTGIITDIGHVRSVEARADTRVTIATGYDTAAIALGASIACSGPCLTVVKRGPGWFTADVSAETIARTAPAMWRPGARLNLERALKVGDELGGHIVTGHVDGVGSVVSVASEGGSWRVVIAAPPALAPYIAAKGSVAVDGVSLTVNDVTDRQDGDTHFALNIVPHTWSHTTFGDLAAATMVNLEVDPLARYLSRMQRYAERA